MASSFSTDLKLELMVTGENAGTWGDNTNNNLNLIQQAIAGFEQVTLSSGGTLALAMTDKAISNARNMVIKFATATIAASTICTIPDSIEKFYIFDATGLTNPANLTIKTASGTGFTLDAAKIYAAYSDGTNLKEISLDTLGGTIGTAHIADDAVTLAKMAPGTDGNIISYDASGNPVAVATGSAGQVLTSAGAGAPPTFSDASGGSVDWQTGSIKTASFTGVAGKGYFIDTTSGVVTITLPSGPSAGDFIGVKDYAGTFGSNNVTVNRNSSKIDGFTNNAVLNENHTSITFIFIDATQGWKVLNDDQSSFAPEYIAATGGTITTVCTNFKVHTFTSPGTFSVTSKGNPLGNDKLGYVIIAGGGGGGSTNSTDDGAGGGAGGYREAKDACDSYTASPLAASAITLCTVGNYGVVIGAGGAGGPGTSGVSGATGSSSSFNDIIGAGGGAARGSGTAVSPTVANGGSGGGSGGGGGVPGKTGGAGNTPATTPPQGNNGGNAASSPPDGSAGGGGGATSAGGNAGGSSAAGGAGATSSINASPVGRAGGGGAAGQSGPDGGGPGGSQGTTNSGGGGGGNQQGGGAGSGGSGLVIIRYKFQG